MMKERWHRIMHIHIGDLTPGLRIELDATAVVVDTTGAVLLEETYHGRTSGLRDIERFTTRFTRAKGLTPPFSQTVRGAVSGLLRASKNQNHICWVEVRSAYPEAVYTSGVVSTSSEHTGYQRSGERVSPQTPLFSTYLRPRSWDRNSPPNTTAGRVATRIVKGKRTIEGRRNAHCAEQPWFYTGEDTAFRCLKRCYLRNTVGFSWISGCPRGDPGQATTAKGGWNSPDIKSSAHKSGQRASSVRTLPCTTGLRRGREVRSLLSINCFI